MRRMITISGLCILAILLLFTITDPNRVPSFILVLPFLLLFVLLLSLVMLLLEKRGLSARRSLKIGMLCASIPIILLVLQSIGQLTIRDVLAIGALFVVSYFYLTRMSASL